MRPTLAPGDRVVAVRAGRVRAGQLVVVRDPRRPSRLLVKRVTEAGPLGYAVAGDNAAASTDSRSFGPVPAVWGRVVYRYHPPGRAGRLR
ncbi:MAG: S26 family signal peptidase, partial [Acidimicrobiales bacterium]